MLRKGLVEAVPLAISDDANCLAEGRGRDGPYAAVISAGLTAIGVADALGDAPPLLAVSRGEALNRPVDNLSVVDRAGGGSATAGITHPQRVASV